MQTSPLFNVVYNTITSAIPPVIRANIDLWVLFKFASQVRLLDQIYNEISSLLSIENLRNFMIMHQKIINVML